MKSFIGFILILLISIFVISWLMPISSPLSYYILPPFIIIGLLFFAKGLEHKAKKIMSISSLIIFFIAILLSIYSVGYAGDQGAVGLIFIWPFAALLTMAIYIILFFLKILKLIRK